MVIALFWKKAVVARFVETKVLWREALNVAVLITYKERPAECRCNVTISHLRIC